MGTGKLLCAVGGLLVAGFAGPARAEICISIDFGSNLLSTASAGLASASNWNNETGGSGANIALADNSGAGTTALLTYGAAGLSSRFGYPNTPDTNLDTIYQHALYGDPLNGGEPHLTITGIPYSSYEVYVYASEATNNTSVLSITDGTTTYYYRSGGGYGGDGKQMAGLTSLTLTTSTNAGSPTVGLAQYQLFTNETSSTFTLTESGSINGQISNNIFGLQIVETPEPGTLVLIGGGLGSLAAFRRRRTHAAR